MLRRLLVSCVLFSLPGFAVAQSLERRAFLGVQVGPLTETQSEITDFGLNIVRVFENSTASRFGLRAGQVILGAWLERVS